MSDYLGDFATSAVVNFKFATYDLGSARVAPLSAFEAADIRIYRDDSATQRTSANGITMTSPFDSVTGLHHLKIDLSDNTDAGFYAAGHDYDVVLLPDTETVDGVAVMCVLKKFSIENRNIKADLRTWLGNTPSGLDANDHVQVALRDIIGTALTETSAGYLAAAFKKFFDVVTPVFTSASVNQSGDVYPLVDTEVAAIKAKTDNLPSDPADASDIAASFSTVNSTLATLATAAALTTLAARIPTALAADGSIKSSLESLQGVTPALLTFIRGLLGCGNGTVGTGSTTTSIVTSSLLPAATRIDQFKGCVIKFDRNTTTAALRGQGTDITGNDALGVLAVTALTDAPVSTDTFTIS